MISTVYSRKLQIKRMTAIAMFCALAYACTATIKIPVGFLTLDVKDALIVLCALLFGPVAGLVIAVTVPFLELITVSGTGVYGFIMNALSSVTFSLTVSLIYRLRKQMSGAVIGLVSGVCVVTAVMILANLLITPYYVGGTVADVAAMIPKMLLPFNLVKATLNAAIVLLLYKPLSIVLKKTGFLLSTVPSRGASAERRPRWHSVLVTVSALVLIVASLLIVFFVLRA